MVKGYWLKVNVERKRIMEKKQYIIPSMEIMDLRTMHAMMDEPLFGPASTPKNPFSGAPKRHDSVF